MSISHLLIKVRFEPGKLSEFFEIVGVDRNAFRRYRALFDRLLSI